MLPASSAGAIFALPSKALKIALKFSCENAALSTCSAGAPGYCPAYLQSAVGTARLMGAAAFPGSRVALLSPSFLRLDSNIQLRGKALAYRCYASEVAQRQHSCMHHQWPESKALLPYPVASYISQLTDPMTGICSTHEPPRTQYACTDRALVGSSVCSSNLWKAAHPRAQLGSELYNSTYFATFRSYTPPSVAKDDSPAGVTAGLPPDIRIMAGGRSLEEVPVEHQKALQVALVGFPNAGKNRFHCIGPFLTCCPCHNVEDYI